MSLVNTAREYRELQAQIKELNAQAEALKQEMIREMDAQQLEETHAGEYTICYSLYESSRFDVTRLKNEKPDLYSTYIKKTVSARFQVA